MHATIRNATVEDAEAITRVNVETWQSSYRGIFPEEFLRSIPFAKRLENTRQFLQKLPPHSNAFVAEVPLTGVAGFAIGGKVREQVQDFDGELFGLYVLLEYQRHGLGRLLLRAIGTFIELQGFTKLVAWTLAASPYTAFYRGIGAVECGKQVREFGSLTRDLVAFGWPSISDLLARLEVLVK